MAVGYHKINTSAARASRRTNDFHAPKFEVVSRGVSVRSPVYGDGVTMDEFVSDCDSIRCDFGEYVVKFSGRAVRVMVRDADAKTTA